MRFVPLLMFSSVVPIVIVLPLAFLLFGSWPATLFWTYVATALWQAFPFLVLGSRHQDPQDAQLEPYFRAQDAMVAAAAKTNLWLRMAGIADRSARHIRLATDIVLWPQTYFLAAYLLVTRGARRFAKAILFEPESYNFPLSAALYTLVVALSAYGLVFAGGNLGWYSSVFLWAVVAALVFRYLSYILGPAALLEDIRTSSNAPQVTFLIVLLSEFASLMLLLPITVGGLTPSEVQMSHLTATIGLAFRPQVWINIIFGDERSLATLLTATATTTFYFGVLTSAFRGLTTGRTDDDYFSIAAAQTQRGEYEAALATLLDIEQKGLRTLYLETVILLNQGKVSEAIERAHALLIQEDGEADVNTLYMLLFGAPAQKSEQTWGALLRSAIDAGADDPTLAMGTMVAIQVDQYAAVEGVLFEPGGLVGKVSRYPVTIEMDMRRLARLGNEMSNAYEGLRERVPVPSTGLARIAYICLIEFQYPEKDLSHPEIRTFLDEIETHAAGLPPAQAQSALLCIMRGQPFIQRYGDYSQRIARIAERSSAAMGRHGNNLVPFLTAAMEELSQAKQRSPPRSQPITELPTMPAERTSLDAKVAPASGTVVTRSALAFNRNDPRTWGPKIRRNAPCPCGSTKIYKECHGRHY